MTLKSDCGRKAEIARAAILFFFFPTLSLNKAGEKRMIGNRRCTVHACLPLSAEATPPTPPCRQPGESECRDLASIRPTQRFFSRPSGVEIFNATGQTPTSPSPRPSTSHWERKKPDQGQKIYSLLFSLPTSLTPTPPPLPYMEI